MDSNSELPPEDKEKLVAPEDTRPPALMWGSLEIPMMIGDPRPGKTDSERILKACKYLLKSVKDPVYRDYTVRIPALQNVLTLVGKYSNNLHVGEVFSIAPESLVAAVSSSKWKTFLRHAVVAGAIKIPDADIPPLFDNWIVRVPVSFKTKLHICVEENIDAALLCFRPQNTVLNDGMKPVKGKDFVITNLAEEARELGLLKAAKQAAQICGLYYWPRVLKKFKMEKTMSMPEEETTNGVFY